MEILLRSAKIIHTESPFHNKIVDILISNGKIKKIGAKLPNPSKVKEFTHKNLHVSLGWVDMNVNLYDPGFEQKETIESGVKAAAYGGFTRICTMPNTQPISQTKAQIEYVLNKAKGGLVTIHPVGALTQNLAGQELADIYDMQKAGAIAFSDGLKPSVSAGMLERALLYVKAFDGLVLNHAEDKSISKNGVMNEGITSTQLGLPAAAALAEEIAVARDLYLLEYTQSKLHLLDISLKRSAELIKAAKRKGLKLSASVNAYNLLLDEKAVGDYDTNYKLNPHLRTAADRVGLLKGLEDGTIDTITSQHNPQDEECKKLEFDKADFGMIGLETCFAIANTATQGKVELSTLIAAFSANARKILGLPVQKIAEGEEAELTLFDPSLKWTFTEKDIQSKSKNTPFVGYEFTGKALGVIANNACNF